MRLSLWAVADHAWPDLLDTARHAEAAAWDGVWLPDRPGRDLQTWSALGALATAIPRLRLGSLISDPADRHPALLVKQAVTVDRLSGGRAVLGLGVRPGEPATEDRLSQLEEACEVVKGLLGRPRTTFRGRHFRLEDAPLEPKALGRLPLLVGGSSDPQALRIAARWADEWNAWGDPATIAGQVRALEQRCAELGRDPAQITRSALAVVVGNDGAPLGSQADTDLQASEDLRSGAEVPRIKISEIAEYQGSGVDELVVADLGLGRGEARRDALEAIRAAF